MRLDRRVFGASALIVLNGLVVTESVTAETGRWEIVLEFGAWGGGYDIAIDSQHELYVLPNPEEVLVYNSQGEYLRGSAGFQAVTGLAIDENDVVYLLETCRVRRYNRQLEPLGSWDSCIGKGTLQTGISIDAANGIVYDGTISSLLKFDTEGVLLANYNHAISWAAVKMLPDGSVWAIAASGFARHYSTEGDVLDEWPILLPDEYVSNPRSLAIDSRGRLFISDNGARVKIFLPSGELDELIDLDFRELFGLELDGDTVLFVGADPVPGVIKFLYMPVTVETTTWGTIKSHFR